MLCFQYLCMYSASHEQAISCALAELTCSTLGRKRCWSWSLFNHGIMDLETSHNAYALDPEAHRRSPPNKSRILERDQVSRTWTPHCPGPGIQDMCRKLKHVEVMGVKLTSCTMSSDRMHVEMWFPRGNFDHKVTAGIVLGSVMQVIHGDIPVVSWLASSKSSMFVPPALFGKVSVPVHGKHGKLGLVDSSCRWEKVMKRQRTHISV